MNFTRIIILSCVVALSACNSTDEKNVATNTDAVATMKIATDSNVIMAAIDSNHTAKNSLDWKGTYKGVLPCADCEGIEIAIMLDADSTYKIETKYLGKKDNKAVNTAGKFVWIDGDHIKLVGLKEDPSTYAVSENKITQLGMSGKKIAGALAAKYVLNKIIN